MEPSYYLDELAKKVIGSAIEVHRNLGPGYLESVYENSLAIEFTKRNIQYRRQSEVQVNYKGENVGQGRLDFLIENQLIVELRTTEKLLPIHKAQVISYLKATGINLGLLVNFNIPVLKYGIQRVIYTN